MRGLKDKVAIVTGGGQGIGRALTLRLAEEGCKVAIFDLKPDAARETEKLAPEGRVATYEVDVGDYAAVAAAAAKVEAELGPIWALVNNAGWDRPAPFLTTDQALWDKIIRINLYGPLNTHHVDRAADGEARRRPHHQHRLRRRARRHQQRGGLFRLQGRRHQLHQIGGARAGEQGRAAQRRLPRADQHADDGDGARRRRAGGEVEGRDGARHSAEAHGRAGGLRRHRRLPRVRRRQLHHRPDLLGRRRHEHDLIQGA